MPANKDQNDIDNAVRLLGDGGVVVFPTDTLYGLGADAFSDTGLERVFVIKLRPPGLAVPLLVSCWDQVELVARDVPEAARRLANRFWPGPLTMILRKAAKLSDRVTGGKDTVAVRMPGHNAPLALARQLGRPITGTSANRSGQQDLLTLDAVEAELGGEVDYIIKAGPAPRGVPSTVIDLTAGAPCLVRLGSLPFEEISALCGWSRQCSAVPTAYQ